MAPAFAAQVADFASRRRRWLIAALAAWVYLKVRARQTQESPKIYCKEDDASMKRLLERTDALRQFSPTPWAASSTLQLVVHTLWQRYHSRRSSFAEHRLECPDGGVVTVAKFIPPPAERAAPRQELAPDAPVLVLLHTIAGRPYSEAEFALRAHERGWHVYVLSRRGHHDRLATPRFNIMGCAQDTDLMAKFVRGRHPDSFIGAAGVSAGSGQVVTYIGQQDLFAGDGNSGPINAAVSLCPAWDITHAFKRFSQTAPKIAELVLNGVKQLFLEKNKDLLGDHPAFELAVQASDMHDFVEKTLPFAGHDTLESYLDECNPIKHYHGSRVPCLILNALDDPLCVEANIDMTIARGTPNFALATTKRGSHVAYREGLIGQSCFMHRLALDFLEEARVAQLRAR